MASERAAALADDFAAANAEAVAFARACPAEAWGRTVPGEGWTVGVILHHIAESHEQSRRWVAAMARVATASTDTAEEIDRANAAHAARRRGRDAGRDGVPPRGERCTARGSCCAACSDDELDRAASVRAGRRRRLPDG